MPCAEEYKVQNLFVVLRLKNGVVNTGKELGGGQYLEDATFSQHGVDVN